AEDPEYQAAQPKYFEWPATAGRRRSFALSKKSYLFTSESVTEGHPDKIADQISDAILDACMKEDPYSRVACETLTATGLVVIAGEITTKAYVDFQSLVRGVVASIGYATHENADYMPTAISLAHKLCQQLTAVRKNGTLPYLRPDGKSQVTLEYDENHKPGRI